MIRAVIFDLGGVVYKWPGLDRRWAQQLGVSPDEFVRALYAGNDEGPLVGAMTAEQWWAGVGERLGIDRAIADRLRRDFVGATRLVAPMVEFIRGLRATHRTAFLSNAWSDTRPRLQRDGIEAAVDAVILSCEVGVAKPDPGIYQVALERLGVVATAAAFVDDAEVNVEAARALGMEGIVCRSASQAIAEVRALVG